MSVRSYDTTIIAKTDGVRLAATVYEPEGEPRAFLQFVHGMAEHRRRYDEVCRMFAEAGFLVAIHDLRGHGDSAADEARIGWFAEKNGWNRAVEDIGAVADAVMRTREGLPRVLFGHSMGTILSRCYIQKHDGEVAALVLTGAPNPNPAAKPGKAMASLICATRGQYYRSPMMNSMLFGSFNKKVKDPLTEFDWLSVNGENVQRYIEDPMCGFMFTAAGYRDMLGGLMRMADGTLYKCENPALPILFAAGECDPCTGGEAGLTASMELLKNAGYKDVTRIVYPGLRHEILNERERTAVVEDINNWITEKL